MKNHTLQCLILAVCAIFIAACNQQPANNNVQSQAFQFAFITDIHVEPERNATEGLLAAIDTINIINPDFVITGGDLIMDALGQSWSRADSLYKLYIKTSQHFKMTVYNTIGNHEIYGIYHRSKADRSHPEFGEKMFTNRLGKSYYSFNHKGWHFMIINSIEEAETGNAYKGYVDSAQMEWIKKDLETVDPERPIIISTHIPMATTFYNVTDNPLYAKKPGDVIVNTPEVLKLFEGHNLKLVLQGHMHILEEIKIRGITFVTAGAISAGWWKGPYYGIEEGFALVTLNGNDFEWEYVDYGWEVQDEE